MGGHNCWSSFSHFHTGFPLKKDISTYWVEHRCMQSFQSSLGVLLTTQASVHRRASLEYRLLSRNKSRGRRGGDNNVKE